MKKILILAANPKGTTRLRLDQEVRDIEEGLKRSKYRDEFELIQRWAVRPRDIQRALLDDKPQIIHFSGHGEGTEGLVFEDEAGNTKLIDGEALANLFRLFADDIDCILLNGCYSQEQAKGIVQHIDFVIGMSRAIADTGAIEFAVGFYDALGAGRSYEFAYNFACSAIQLNTTAHLTSKNTRKLVPIASQPSSSDEHTIPVFLRRDGLPEEGRTPPSNTDLGVKSETKLDPNLFITDLSILQQAGQENLGVLERQIALEELKFKQNIDEHLKNALEWLKSNMKKISRESGNYALANFTGKSVFLTPDDKEDFQWNVEKYIETIYYAILSNSESLLDEPAISPSIKSKELYGIAFRFIVKKIPPKTEKKVIDLMSERFDYLLDRLFLAD